MTEYTHTHTRIHRSRSGFSVSVARMQVSNEPVRHDDDDGQNSKCFKKQLT